MLLPAITCIHMDKQTKIIPINPVPEETQSSESVLVDSLLSTLSDIDQELEKHLNSDDNKS